MTPEERLKIALGGLMLTQLQLADQNDKLSAENARLTAELEEQKAGRAADQVQS